MDDPDDLYQGEDANLGPQVVADHVMHESKAHAHLLPPKHEMRIKFKDVENRTRILSLDQVVDAQPRPGGKVKIWIKSHKKQEFVAIVAFAGLVFTAVRNARMHEKK
jgi:hypothetical protein